MRELPESEEAQAIMGCRKPYGAEFTAKAIALWLSCEEEEFANTPRFLWARRAALRRSIKSLRMCLNQLHSDLRAEQQSDWQPIDPF